LSPAPAPVNVETLTLRRLTDAVALSKTRDPQTVCVLAGRRGL